jgi:hypothetical protein
MNVAGRIKFARRHFTTKRAVAVKRDGRVTKIFLISQIRYAQKKYLLNIWQIEKGV